MNGAGPWEAALSLGSNLGDRRGRLAGALRGLSPLLDAMEISSVWESEPVEVPDEQPLFLNLCAVGRTRLEPEDLLERCQALEREAGRARHSHRRPRPLDLDLLYHGESRRDSAALSLPHPGMPRRRFVLEPLAELRPDWRHPEEGRNVREMLANLNSRQSLRRLPMEANWWNQG